MAEFCPSIAATNATIEYRVNVERASLPSDDTCIRGIEIANGR